MALALQYLGEIRLMAFDMALKDWEPCDGRLLPINTRNRDLFNYMGTAYGGDGTTTFGVPDLRGAAAVHRGVYEQGERGGMPSVTLTWPETAGPGHTHAFQCVTCPAKVPYPNSQVLAAATANMYVAYDASTLVTLPAQTVQPVGGQPHENMPPYQAVSFYISTLGRLPRPA